MWNLNNSCCCKPTITSNVPICNVDLALTSDKCISNVCGNIEFTLTITNNSSNTIYCSTLNLNTEKCLAINPCTILVNDVLVENANPCSIDIGTIAPGAIVTVKYTAVVMSCCRCIKYRVPMTFGVCCCFEQKCFKTLSNVRLIQVCCCCCNNNC